MAPATGAVLCGRGFGLVPRSLRHSLGHSYITRGLGVVDCTLGACPSTCSPRHLTSHLSHTHISTIHSLRPQGLNFVPSFLFCVFSVCSGYEPGVLRQRESHRASISSYTSRLKPISHWQFSWSTFLIKRLDQEISWIKSWKAGNTTLVQVFRSSVINILPSWSRKLINFSHWNINERTRYVTDKIAWSSRLKLFEREIHFQLSWSSSHTFPTQGRFIVGRSVGRASAAFVIKARNALRRS